MASLLNNASLLLNPAGSTIAYKEDKIYSVLPSNGDGDFTFTGGDGGTRVNQDGYIEVTPHNLLNNSNNFDSGWGVYEYNGGALSKNSGYSDPFGGTNAWLFEVTLGTGGILLTQNETIEAGVDYTLSVWMKGDVGGEKVQLDLKSTTSSGPSGELFTLTTEWVRYDVTVTNDSGTARGFQFRVTTVQASGDQDFYVYGAQLNKGNLRPYQPTTDRLNYPRITYENGRGAFLGEPQRTNTATYSEDLTNGVWSKQNVSITANDTISPDGTQNADRVTRSSTSSTYFWIEDTRTASDRANSMFFKKGTIDQVTILGNSYSSGTYATFNLSNGTISGSAGCTPFIKEYKDGWYRCGFVQNNSVSYPLLITLNGYTNESVTNGEYLYAWGGQSELGRFPTSYIPTTSATVTRPRDISYVDGISSIIGQTQGVLYAQVTPSQLTDGSYICISDNTTTNRLIFGFESGTQALRWYTPYGNGSGGSVVVGQQCKIAAAYNVNDLSIYLNGVQVANVTSGQLSGTYSHLGLDSYTATAQTFRGTVNNVALFNTRLPNTQLAELTTVRSGSGGEISYYGPYTIHTFTGSATFTPSFTGEVEVLVVAGGGGGESHNAGGGGAGGVVYLSSAGVSTGTGYTITIGAGGLGSLDNGGTVTVQATNGSNSSAFGLEATGGGAGGTWDGTTTGRVGSDGGSGGGGGASTTTSQPGGSGIPGQGNNGGNGSTDAQGRSGGGGGGAGEAGGNAVASNQAGDGGDGLPYSISGFSKYYGGGGGGAPRQSTDPAKYGDGGLGGGGSYRLGSMNLITGVDGTGGGGSGIEGASLDHPRPNGGSGIVIIRYLT